ncbi:MAG: hypothetical protein OXC42_01640, partial [Gammaproteobacteria bacterium]|nr:hypothetical protein [Gammaproteobacteria bacterium]
MKWVSKAKSGIALLGLGALLSAPGMADDTQRAGWYVGAGAGVNWVSDLKQAGWNRDTICYPVDDCSNKDSIGGDRWVFDLGTDRGSGLELSIGQGMGDLGLELSGSSG